MIRLRFILYLIIIPLKALAQYHQLIYEYRGFVSSETESAIKAGSLWEISAQLTIDVDEINRTKFFQLSNLKTNLYNGPLAVKETEFVDIILDSENVDIKNTFGATYHTNGLIDYIFFKSGEDAWVKNIKKSILAVFQFDNKKLEKITSIASEDSLYGICNYVEYYVSNKSSDFLIFDKNFDHSSCAEKFNENQFSSKKWSNLPIFICHKRAQNAIITNTNRHYVLDKRKERIIKVISDNHVYIQPFQAETDAYKIISKQIFSLKNHFTKTNGINLTNFENFSSLTYEIKESQDFTTNGRANKWSQEVIFHAIHRHMDNIFFNLQQTKIPTNPMEIHNETLTTLLHLVTLLNSETLNKLFTDLSIGTSYKRETKRHIFLELLPQIGTKSSLIFMKKLILDRDLNDLRILKLLATYPFYVLEPDENLLNEFDIFLNLNNNFRNEIKHTSILSFCTLISKTYSTGKCSQDRFSDYIRKIFYFFSESELYDDKLVYLQCLNNLQHEIVDNYLSPIISGENQYSHHLRFLAVWATMNTIPASPQKVFDLYWPIFRNQSEHIEIRVAAITMLLISQPTSSRLMSLYWYLHNDKGHIYNFFYTTLLFLQNTKYPCYLHLGRLAKNMIRVIHKPKTNRYWTTGNYLFDYIDKSRDFGAMAQFFLVGNPINDQLNVFYVQLNNFASNIKYQQFAIYLKLQGIESTVLSYFPRSPQLVLNEQFIQKLFQENNFHVKLPEDIHFEIIMQMQSKTIFCKYLNISTFNNTIQEIKKNIYSFLTDYHINYQNIEIPMINKNLMVTDLGTPIHIVDMISLVSSFRGNFTYEEESKFISSKHDLDFRYYSFGHKWICVYNPINNIYHGIDKSKILYSQFLLNGEIILDFIKNYLQFKTKREPNKSSSIVLHFRTISFMNNVNNEQLMKNKKREFIIKPNDVIQNEKLYFYNSSDLNMVFYVNMFDYEKSHSYESLINFAIKTHESNSGILPYAKSVLMLFGIIDYITLSPPEGNRGLSFNIDLALNNSTELILTIEPKISMLNFKSSDINVKIDIKLLHKLSSIKKDNEVYILQDWTMNATLKYHTMRSNKSFDMVLSKRVNNVLNSIVYVNVIAKNHAVEESLLSFNTPKIYSFEINAAYLKDNQTLDANSTSKVEIIVTEDTTQEELQLSKKQTNWPYEHCANESKNLQFIPITEACYTSWKQFQSHFLQKWQVRMKKIPDWIMINIRNNIDLVNYFINHKNIIDNLRLSIDQALLDKMNENIDLSLKQEFSLKYFRNLYYEALFDLDIQSFIMISKNQLITINQNVLNYTGAGYLVDCSKNSKFSFYFDNRQTNNLSIIFHVAPNDSLIINNSMDNIKVILNEKVLNFQNQSSSILYSNIDMNIYYEFFTYSSKSISVYSNLSEIRIFYTVEYILIIIPSYYKGFLCGICSK